MVFVSFDYGFFLLLVLLVVWLMVVSGSGFRVVMALVGSDLDVGFNRMVGWAMGARSLLVDFVY